MKRNSLLMGVGLAALVGAPLVLASASAAPVIGHEAAIKACTTANPMQPAEVLSAVDDAAGIGFSLVWLSDAEGNLWLCDADADGNVYTYSLVMSDLLQGGGADLIGLQLTADGTYEGEPQQIAEKVCVAYLTDGGEVIGSTPDGLESDPGFVVYVKGADGATYLCNATGDAMIWAFETMGDPIDFEQQVS
jgi:hypothetical protein